MPQAYAFDDQGFDRVIRSVQKSEREPRAAGEGPLRHGLDGAQKMFVLASDPSDYDDSDELPKGYRGHAVGYAIPAKFDLTRLPEVPGVDELLESESSGLEKWSTHRWTKTHTDKLLGRPVLINLCRYAKGAFFRGSVVCAQYLPGFRCSDQWRNDDKGFAAPTPGDWNLGSDLTPQFREQAGWCALGNGWQSLVVTLDELLDPHGSTKSAAATVKAGEHVELLAPGSSEGPTVHVFDDAGRGIRVADTDQVVVWDALRFRWQVTTSQLLLGKTDAEHDVDTNGTVSIHGVGTKGSEPDTGVNVTAFNRFANLDATKWVLVEWIGNGYDLVSGRCA